MIVPSQIPTTEIANPTAATNPPGLPILTSFRSLMNAHLSNDLSPLRPADISQNSQLATSYSYNVSARMSSVQGFLHARPDQEISQSITDPSALVITPFPDIADSAVNSIPPVDNMIMHQHPRIWHLHMPPRWLMRLFGRDYLPAE